MNILNQFYQKTHYFWIVSRVFLIVLFAIAIFNQINLKALSSLIVYGIFSLYIFCMTFIFFMEIIKKSVPKFCKIFTGITSIFFGLVLTYLILYVGGNKYGLGVIGFLIIPVWIILFGFWEMKTLMNVEK